MSWVRATCRSQGRKHGSVIRRQPAADPEPARFPSPSWSRLRLPTGGCFGLCGGITMAVLQPSRDYHEEQPLVAFVVDRMSTDNHRRSARPLRRPRLESASSRPSHAFDKARHQLRALRRCRIRARSSCDPHDVPSAALRPRAPANRCGVARPWPSASPAVPRTGRSPSDWASRSRIDKQLRHASSRFISLDTRSRTAVARARRRSIPSMTTSRATPPRPPTTPPRWLCSMARCRRSMPGIGRSSSSGTATPCRSTRSAP